MKKPAGITLLQGHPGNWQSIEVIAILIQLQNRAL